MTLATDERAAISATFARTDPDRPTLCTGWTARDLLAHLLVRERQPWLGAGAVVPVLAPVTDRAMAGWAATPWPDMVAALRDGPPAWSPTRIGRVDAVINGLELYVHHEDLRRGEPGWVPRPPDPVRDDDLWAQLGPLAPLMLRRSPVGVAARRPSGAQRVLRTGAGLVTLVGEPGEIVLHLFGRDAAQVELTGDAEDVARYRAARD